MRHVGVWGNSIPGRGNCKCKGPEAGSGLMCLMCLKNSETYVTGTQ